MTETMETAPEQYIPGECNLGTAERRRRIVGGWVGLAATAAGWFVAARLAFPRPVRLLLFFPAFISAVGFVQAWNRFCVAFGMAGLFNFGPAGERHRVVDPSALARDRAQARRLLLFSTVLAALVSLAAALL